MEHEKRKQGKVSENFKNRHEVGVFVFERDIYKSACVSRKHTTIMKVVVFIVLQQNKGTNCIRAGLKNAEK